MSVPVSTGGPASLVTAQVLPAQVLPAQVWAKLSSDVRARAIGLVAQLALNLVLARTRADDGRAGLSTARKEEGGDARTA
jgi:hypothetical protein